MRPDASQNPVSGSAPLPTDTHRWQGIDSTRVAWSVYLPRSAPGYLAVLSGFVGGVLMDLVTSEPITIADGACCRMHGPSPIG